VSRNYTWWVEYVKTVLILKMAFDKIKPGLYNFLDMKSNVLP
jgi:hypothetical protein